MRHAESRFVAYLTRKSYEYLLPAMTHRDPLYADWGARLREKRLAAGISQQALADAADSTNAHISNIERGLTSVSDKLRIRLATALGTTVAELFPYPDAVPA